MRKTVSLIERLWAAVLCETVDRVVPFHGPPREIHRKRKRLLVVRLDRIGDFLIFLDTLKSYRILYPESEWSITLFGNKTWADLAIDLPFIDGFCWIDRERFCRNPSYRYQILQMVRRERFDVAIQPAFSREYTLGDAIIRASGASERIGSVGDRSNINTWQKRRSDHWYSRLIPAKQEMLSELERNAEFLRGIGLEDFRASPPVYPMDILPEFPGQKDFGQERPYFVVFPGAGLSIKRWAPDRFARIARFVHGKTGWQPVLCGGTVERGLAEKVISHAQDLPWINLAGKSSLRELASILHKAGLCIGNDSSAIHLASAVGCPAVCVMGGGHFGRFFPYGDPSKNRVAYYEMDCFFCNWQCRWPEPYCLSKIRVESVQKEINIILKSIGTGSG